MNSMQALPIRRMYVYRDEDLLADGRTPADKDEDVFLCGEFYSLGDLHFDSGDRGDFVVPEGATKVTRIFKLGAKSVDRLLSLGHQLYVLPFGQPDANDTVETFPIQKAVVNGLLGVGEEMMAFEHGLVPCPGAWLCDDIAGANYAAQWFVVKDESHQGITQKGRAV